MVRMTCTLIWGIISGGFRLNPKQLSLLRWFCFATSSTPHLEYLKLATLELHMSPHIKVDNGVWEFCLLGPNHSPSYNSVLPYKWQM